VPARDEPFSAQERQATFAAAIYVMAYSARCEHAIDMEGNDLRGGSEERFHVIARSAFGSGLKTASLCYR